MIIKQERLDGTWNSWWKPWQHIALKQLPCICSVPCSRTFQHGAASVDSQMKAAVAEFEAWHIPSSGPCGLPVICLHLTRDLLIALLHACLALSLSLSPSTCLFPVGLPSSSPLTRLHTPTNGFLYSPLEPNTVIASFSCKHHILPKRWLKTFPCTIFSMFFNQLAPKLKKYIVQPKDGKERKALLVTLASFGAISVSLNSHWKGLSASLSTKGTGKKGYHLAWGHANCKC